jgi:hypothetical protein
VSFDIQKIIDKSDQSHTKETEDDDIGFLSIEEGVVDQSVVLEDIGKPNHQSHDEKKNTASHGRGSLFVFMELSEYLRFFSCDRCFADSFSEFKSSQDADVDRIEDPRDEKRDQCKHDDIVELD